MVREESAEATLTLSRRSVDFFRREAERRHVPYQRMIRALVDACARRHGGDAGIVTLTRKCALPDAFCFVAEQIRVEVSRSHFHALDAQQNA